jgi:hypothetical protein
VPQSVVGALPAAWMDCILPPTYQPCNEWANRSRDGSFPHRTESGASLPHFRSCKVAFERLRTSGDADACPCTEVAKVEGSSDVLDGHRLSLAVDGSGQVSCVAICRTGARSGKSGRNALHWWGESGENAIFVSSSAMEKAPALWSRFERAVNASVDVSSAPNPMTRSCAGVSHEWH